MSGVQLRSIDDGDAAFEGRSSNGLLAKTDGSTILYGAGKESNINGNTSSVIALLTTDKDIDFPEGNNNKETKSSSPDPNKVTTTKSNNNAIVCDDEFNDVSTVLLNWENENSNVGSSGVGTLNKYNRVDVNGWGPYAANNVSGIKDGDLDKAQENFLDNFIKANKVPPGVGSIQDYLPNEISNPKLIIDNYPPGLRLQLAQLSYNTGQWWTRLLVAVGPDFLGAKDSNGNPLGIPYKKSINIISDEFAFVRDKAKGDVLSELVYNPKNNPGKNPNEILWYDERIQKIIDQYDEIIKVYNKDKAAFIEALYSESIRFYKALAKGALASDKYKFWSEYAQKAKGEAIKYINCPQKPLQLKKANQQQVTQQQVVQQQVTQQQATQQQVTQQQVEDREELPNAAPVIDETNGGEDFTFLSNTDIEIDPVQIFNIIDATNNENESPTDNDIAIENAEQAKIEIENKLKQQPQQKQQSQQQQQQQQKQQSSTKSERKGSILKLIENNKEYGNLGDLVYHPSPLYAQGDPDWGSYSDGKLTQSRYGCCYNTLSMLCAWYAKDPSKTPKWHWTVKKNQSVSVVPGRFPNAVNAKEKYIYTNSTNDIDKILKDRPVGFEWKGGKDRDGIGFGWDKGYNNYHGTIKRSPSGSNYKGKPIVTVGISYTCCRQHWMVIVGANKDGTYTIFDPAGGVMRYKQTKVQIEAGLNRIVYIY